MRKKVSKKSRLSSTAINTVLVLVLIGSSVFGIRAHTAAVKQARIEACLDTKVKLHQMGADATLIHSFSCADL